MRVISHVPDACDLLLAVTASCGQAASPQRLQRRTNPRHASSRRPTTRPTPPADSARRAATRRRQPTRAGGPNVAPTAAPGVAFNYRYAFRLAAPSASPRCRSSMRSSASGSASPAAGSPACTTASSTTDDIEAMLAFKLDPAIARQFGRDGVDAVAAADGMLTESEISGTDVGTAIRAAGRSHRRAEGRAARGSRRGSPRGGIRAGRARAARGRRRQCCASRSPPSATSREAQQEIAGDHADGVPTTARASLVPGPTPPPSIGEALDARRRQFPRRRQGPPVRRRSSPCCPGLLLLAARAGGSAWLDAAALVRPDGRRPAVAAAEPQAERAGGASKSVGGLGRGLLGADLGEQPVAEGGDLGLVAPALRDRPASGCGR